ncbi:septation protein A [Aestuariispira ectoiniformans]|uniref:septation protein A n=1 Tax=Aestuariispira ectoiniformans TaxID=2775080 RepID=UPI00223AD176|nr:septation protein A [Aestuariispira ectoiniformans]
MSNANASTRKPEPKWLKPVADYGPLAAFLIAYWQLDLIAATKAIVIATGIAIVLSLIVARRVPMMPLVTAIVVAIFGGLTIYLQDETFIKMKPTIVQVAFAVILGVGLLLKRVWLQRIFSGSIDISEAAWRTLTVRFIFFFLASAVLNEIVWRTQSTDIWVTFKVFGLMGLTFVFIISQMPFLNRAMEAKEKEDKQDDDQ